MRIIKENSTNNENRGKAMEQCPVVFTFDKIGGRWKPLILWNLRNTSLRYSELRKQIDGITEKMLIQHLKQLESDSLVERKVISVMPPHVEYSLSVSGHELMNALHHMAHWGLKQTGQIEKADALAVFLNDQKTA